MKIGQAPEKLSPMAKIQLELSDVISFHNYDPPDQFRAEVTWLQSYGRPILCTEYMARPRGSTFAAILPIAKEDKVAAINWGFVAGNPNLSTMGFLAAPVCGPAAARLVPRHFQKDGEPV